MTDNKHPITPPPELVQQWLEEYYGTRRTGEVNAVEQHLATQAANWGADQQLQLDAEQINQAWQRGADHELEACCQTLYQRYDIPTCIAPEFAEEMRDWLRAARRPKPPSLKELNLKHLEVMERDGHYLPEIIADLRRAIESLPS